MSEQYCGRHDFYYSVNHIIDVICPWCEIDRLKGELEEARREVDYQVQDNLTTKEALKRQLDASQALLAEARAEVESIGYKPLAAIKEEVRQEAARTILDMLSSCEYHEDVAFIEAEIIRLFKLEG